MMAVLLAAKYLGFSLTVDSCYNNRDRIFHVSQVETHNGNLSYDGNLSYRGVTVTALREFPEVLNYTKFNWGVETLVLIEKEGEPLKSFNQTGIFSVDTSFTQIFNLEPVFGGLEGALREPNSIIITRTIAKKYFGEIDPIGMSIRAKNSWGGERNWNVKCVVEDPPRNSTLWFNILVNNPDDSNDLWQSPVYNQYLLLQDSENYEEVAQKISAVMNRLPIFKDDKRHISIFLDPLKPVFSKFEIFLISTGVLILVLSWISFSNISIVQFMQRQREVFIRRSVGANNAKLVKQYLFETGSIVFFAIVISIIFLFGVYDYFSQLTKNHLIPLSSNKYWINTIFLVVFLIGALLPSTYILGTLLIKSKTTFSGGNKFRFSSGISKRRMLAGAQFGIAIFMVTSTFIIERQTKYLYRLDKGIDLENKIIIKPPKDSWEGKGDRSRVLRNKLRQIPWISNVSSSSTIPGQPYRQEINLSLFGSNEKVLMYVNQVNRRFLPTYQIKVLAGDNFPLGRSPANRDKVLINEISMSLLGLELSSAVGSRLIDENDKIYTVIGVVENYHKTSPKDKIGPMIFKFNPNQGYFTINYSLQSEPSDEHMDKIKSIWKDTYFDQPFEYFSLSTYYHYQFNNEDQLLQIMKIFTFVAIFLACFSLIGLSIFETSNNKLEVGVRKIFGASSYNVFFLFLKKYLILFLLIILILSPAIYYLVSQWLNEFSYRIEVRFVHIIVPSVSLLIISFTTIGFHIIKISRIDPVKILREK